MLGRRDAAHSSPQLRALAQRRGTFLNIAVGRMEESILSATPSAGERVTPAVEPVGEVAQAWQCIGAQVCETAEPLEIDPRRRGQHLEAAGRSGIHNDHTHR